jgi:chlorobactene glucosyltransferase
MADLGAPFVFLSDITATVVLVLLSVRLWRNLRFLRRVAGAASGTKAPAPRVSVLVPARDEARTVTACVASLLAQAYPTFDVLVLDDASRDGTGGLLDALAAESPSLTVIHSTDDSPPGWNGKSYACQRLANRATGEWLLFTDADTQHTPQSVALGVAQAQTLGVSLLSAMPRQVTMSWSERLLVSCIMDFLPLLGVDLAALPGTTRGPVAANGQYVLVRADHYQAVGGHAAISGALVDDIALARLFRECGYAVGLTGGRAMVSCRMYTSMHTVWSGFAKNLWLGLETASARKGVHARLAAALFAWCYASVCLAPFFIVVSGPTQWLSMVVIAWLLLVRAATNRALRRPFVEILTTHVALWCVLALSLEALARRWRHQTITWKGRAYPGRPMSG